MRGREAAAAVALALAARVAVLLAASRPVADVVLYERVARHVLDVSWNPYLTSHLYPYPPVWVWLEAGSEWLARRTGAPFPMLVKLPVVAADALLVWMLARWPGAGRAAWLYALHPVSLLVTAVHGQFDALMLLPVLAAVRAREAEQLDRSALALAAAVAVKSFPVVLLPILLATLTGWRARLRYALLATVPVALLLLPFAAADLPALRRELFGYSGIADFGWIGVARGAAWLAGGRLARSEPEHWPALVAAGKMLFLAAWAGLVALQWRRRGAAGAAPAVQAVLLAFLVLYGAISAQYLLWAVPLGLLVARGSSLAYAAAATLALCGFYLFLAPGLLLPVPEPLPGSGVLWVAGAAATLAVSAVSLAGLLRRRLR